MRSISKLPVYAGITTLVLAVLVTSIQLGTRSSVTNTQSRASTVKSSYQLQFATPNTITVLLTSEKPVAGVDVVLAFEPSKIHVLPSTLMGTNQFVTSGASVDEQNGTFRFSALTDTKVSISSGVVAQFKVEKIDKEHPISTSLKPIVSGTDNSLVVVKDTLEQIVPNALDISFTLP